MKKIADLLWTKWIYEENY